MNICSVYGSKRLCLPHSNKQTAISVTFLINRWPLLSTAYQGVLHPRLFPVKSLTWLHSTFFSRSIHLSLSSNNFLPQSLNLAPWSCASHASLGYVFSVRMTRPNHLDCACSTLSSCNCKNSLSDSEITLPVSRINIHEWYHGQRYIK